MSGPLRGLRVLVTRPEAQAGSLCRAIERAGGEAARLPLVAIEPVLPLEAARAALAAARDADGWIFTSRNAVFMVVDAIAGRLPPLYAIGRATAAALRDAGASQVIVPDDGQSSEHLLALPDLTDVSGKRFVLITGDDGRGLIASKLRERGATVDELVVYRRRPLDYDADRVEAEIAMADAIIVTSSQGLERLWTLTPTAARPLLQSRTLVVPSARVLEDATRYGFQHSLVTDDISDDGWLRCLEGWRRASTDGHMTEQVEEVPEAAPTQSPAAATPAPTPTPPSRRGAVAAWTLVVLLLAALVGAGYLLWRDHQQEAVASRSQRESMEALGRQTAELQAQVAELANRQADSSKTAQRNSLAIASIENRLQETDRLMSRISEELMGGRRRFQLVAIEQLLMMANDRLLLDHDVPSSIAALTVAERRLAALGDPALYKVREALAAERAALEAVPRSDLQRAALDLAALLQRVPSLRLKASVPPHGGEPASISQGPFAAAPADTRNAAQRIWDSIRTAVVSLFTIRRDDDAQSLRLLPPEQETLVYAILTLRLEAAKVALLRRQTAAYRDALTAAEVWLRDQFRAEDPGVAGALRTIAAMKPLELDPPLPDISDSLSLLREQMQAREP